MTSPALTMDEDDSSSILENSLFYSCLSSAADFDEHDGKGGGGNSSTNNEGNKTGGSRITESLPSSHENQNNGQSKDDARTPTIPLRRENKKESSSSNNAGNDKVKNNTISIPSSTNSSWSILSETERPIVRSITFNRDRTCLIVSTTRGVRVRTLESLHSSLQNLKVDVDNNNNNNNHWMHDVPLPPDGATYAQLLHNTSLLAVVKPSSPRCCYLYNAKNASSSLAVLPLSAAVKRVELQRRVLVAMTVDLRLHVFHMTDGGGDVTQQKNGTGNNNHRGGLLTGKNKKLRPTLITTLNIYHPSDSPRNVTRGLDAFNAGSYFDLSTNEDSPYLVCKSFNGTQGTVRVYDPTTVHNTASITSCNASVGSGRSAKSTTSSWYNNFNYNSLHEAKKIKRRIQLLTTIETHNHSITRMLIGGGGKEKQTFLATASSRGTTIRVYGLPRGDQLWAWHRGSKACQFHSLSWNGTADRLAAYGSTGTIHVFDWQKKKEPAESVDDDDDSRDFEKVYEEFRVFDKTASQANGARPLLRRIGSSIKRRASGASRTKEHRSMAKLTYKPTVLVGAAGSAGSNANSPRSQPLVLSLLDRNHSEDRKNDLADKEDTLVVCSMDGELRQYSVKNEGSIGLIQIEDVLGRN